MDFGINFKKELNEEQYEAVTSSAQYLRIIAGAGSGKTRVLTYRFAYLISEEIVRPHEILAFTFTNKVAKEMKQRVVKLLGFDTPLYLSTFHSFCATFLRKEIPALNMPKNFSIIDDSDTESLIKSICIKEEGLSKTDPMVKNAINYIYHCKGKGLYPIDIVDNSRTTTEETFFRVYNRYEILKRESNSVDFSDLILYTRIILKEFPDIRQYWCNRFKHILVDEFQDTDNIQDELIRLLSTPATNLFVVGDPDQTIYSWRGANQSIILGFGSKFSKVETIVLNKNYRSNKNILEAANNLIAYNKERYEKDLVAVNESGENIVVYSAKNKFDEVDHVINEIKKIKVKGSPYCECAILYRSSYLSLEFEKGLSKNGIPFRIYGGTRFFHRKVVKEALAYFKLFINVDDNIAFEKIINTPSRKMGDSSIDKLKAEASSHNLSMFRYVMDIGVYETSLGKFQVAKLTELAENFISIKTEMEDEYWQYPALLRRFLRSVGFYEYVENLENGSDKVLDVEALIEDFAEFAKDGVDNAFEQWMENCALSSAQDDQVEGDFISLMTVHTAKGLEYDNVFIVGFNDGIFPSYRSVEENNGMEEERRLAYVAFTRARKRLFLSFSSYSYFKSSEYIQLEVSKFLNEAKLEIQKPIAVNKNNFTVNNYSSESYQNKPRTYDTSHLNRISITLPKSNNAVTWHVGDQLRHDSFGLGEVKEVSGEMIRVEFAEHGLKLLMGNHPKVHKINGVA